MLSLVLSEMSPLVTTARPPSSKTELLEESVPSEIVLVVLVVGLEQENFYLSVSWEGVEIWSYLLIDI